MVLAATVPKSSDPPIVMSPTTLMVFGVVPRLSITPLLIESELLTLKGRLAVLVPFPPAVKL